MVNLKKLIPAREAINELQEQLETVRDLIVAHQDAISRIDNAPVPVDEAMSGFIAWMEETATSALDLLNIDTLLTPNRAERGFHLPMGYEASKTLLGLLIASNQKGLADLIEGQLRDLTYDQEVISSADRPKRLQAARDTLLKAELAEEAIIRALEGIGAEIQRRTDADPRAVLASDTSLAA